MSNTPNIEAAVSRAAGFVLATWQQAVMGSQSLPGMKPLTVHLGLRQLYADSIVLKSQMRDASGTSQRVVALKKIAKDLEDGTGSFDMKPMLLGGPKARMGKKGRYNIIPFRHGTSSTYSPNSNFPTMAKDIYKQARQLKATISANNRTLWGGKLTGTEGNHPAGKNPTSGYQHKNGRYEGMVRIEKTYAKATQSKYMTFRVVSDNSAPGSWIHPGYKAHRVAEAVTNFCRPAIEDMVRNAAILDLQEAFTSVGVN